MQKSRQVLFGRDSELGVADLALATAASGTPQVLLVSGDAGLGKTSVVNELAARGEALGFTVLTGHCLDIATRRPFGAVQDALRPYVTRRQDVALPPVARRLAPLLRGQAATVVEPSTTLMEDLRLLLAELVERGPVLLTLEDMHWAGVSTQEFAVAIARTARGPLLLALTFRPEDLHRRHRFRTALRDIERAPGAVPIALEPLDRQAVTRLVEARSGGPDPALADALLTRSGGNPFYIEELLAAGADEVPRHLSDLLLARIDALNRQTRDLLRCASVDGTRIDQSVLRDATGLGDAAVTARLRAALEANVLTISGGHLAFRHALMREALYADLLPAERAQAHTAVATALEAQADAHQSRDAAALGRLAFHWSAAENTTKAFAASIRAGQAAHKCGAPEAIAQFQRAVDLWDRVPQPIVLGGIDKAELHRVLSDAAWANGDWQRAIGSLRAALAEVELGTDRLVASRVYSSYGRIPVEVDGLGHGEALGRAVAYAEGSPSPELAKALCATGWWHWHRFAVEQAADYFGRALGVATAAGSSGDRAEAGIGLGNSLALLGRYPEGLTQLRRTVDIADAAGLPGSALEAQADLAHLLLAAGELGAGKQLAASGRLRAQAAGLPKVATFSGTVLVDALRWNGQFDEADEVLEELRRLGMFEFDYLCQRSSQLLARGDLKAALPIERRMQWWLNESDSLWDPFAIAREVDLFTGLGKVAEASTVADRLLMLMTTAGSLLQVSVAARAAYSALIAARAAGVATPAGMERRAADALQRSLEGWSDQWSRTIHAAEALHAAAVARDLDGQISVTEWRAAEAAASAFGAYHVLQPRLGLAHSLLGAHQRDEARALLLDVVDSARHIGARWLQDQATRLARRNRISIPDRKPPSRLAALTPRELEVLEVLATGATNRAIARRLSISEKTVSVHVTNLLTKLGAVNRGEAAAIARGQEADPPPNAPKRSNRESH